MDRFRETVLAIQELNQGADISFGGPNFGLDISNTFFCSIPAEQLILPNGFHFDGQGIVDENKTIQLMVQGIPKDKDIRFLPKKAMDVSHSVSRSEIVLAIQELNPYANISLGDPRDLWFAGDSSKNFYSSIPAEWLILPKGFYYNGYGITNKNNINWSFTELVAREIPANKDIRFLPKKVIDVSQSTDINEVAQIIQQLNPYVEIRLTNPEFDLNAKGRFFSSAPAEYLALPKGFYHTGRGSIISRNADGSVHYSLGVENLAYADARNLMPKFDPAYYSRISKAELDAQIDKALEGLRNLAYNNDTNIKLR